VVGTERREPDYRAAVVDASVDVLLERGLQRFTTPVVAARAGVAQETLLHHFPTRQDLLVATVESAIAATITDATALLVQRLHDEGPVAGRDLVRLVVEVLWEAYNDERAVATYEVRAGSRTDPTLAAGLRSMLATFDEGSADMASFLVPEALSVSGDEFRATYQLVTSALQGRAMTRRSFPDPVADSDVIDSLVDVVHARFQAAWDATIPGRMSHQEPDA
jgi:AcrR family transcriptional regulator